MPGKDIALPDEVEQRSKAWMLFINFSKFSATSKEKKEWSLLEMMLEPWNAYTADLPKVAAYLHLVNQAGWEMDRVPTPPRNSVDPQNSVDFGSTIQNFHRISVDISLTLPFYVFFSFFVKIHRKSTE